MVCVSTAGLATPSLDALLMERLPCRAARSACRSRPRLRRRRSWGCRAPRAGARGVPGRPVLLVVVELCALTFRTQRHLQQQHRRRGTVRRWRRCRGHRRRRRAARCLARRASTRGRARSTSWDGASRTMASACCSRATSLRWCAAVTVACCASFSTAAASASRISTASPCTPAAFGVLEALEHALELPPDALDDSRDGAA